MPSFNFVKATTTHLEQVEMGVAVRMACLEALIGGRRNALVGAVA